MQEKAGAIHISSQEQYKTLVSYPGVTLVDFYADWCGPCKSISPLIEKAALAYSASRILKVRQGLPSTLARHSLLAPLLYSPIHSFTFGKPLTLPPPSLICGAASLVQVNVDSQQAIAASEGIQAMPTFKLFKNGILVEETRGADPRKIQEMLRNVH